MSNQKNVFKLAECVLFEKKGNTKVKRDTMTANYKAILAAFKDIRTLFMHRDAPCLKLLSETKEGWRTTVEGSESSGVVNANKQVMMCIVKKLAFYGKQTNTGFKITDWRLKALWDAIVNFVKIYGKKIGLTGDLEMQHASMLYWLNKKYDAYQTAKAYARAVEDVRKKHEQEKKAAEEKAKKEEMKEKKRAEKEAAEKKAAEDAQVEADKEAGGDVDDWEDAW
tara:strand:- start:143 stop:814 length:672 start_codon:yes stop_codon:yes gene_type:complete